MDKLDIYLEKHAKPSWTGAVKTKYTCQECRDTGWVMLMQDGYEVMRRCNCYAVSRVKELAERSGLSGEFRKKSFDSFETFGNPVLVNARNKAVNYIKNFMETRHGRYNSIMFCGQPGSGKTHLGTAICSSLMATGIPAIYMPYRNAMTKIKQSITDEASYSKVLGMYMDADVLYIDDMLKGKLTETDVNVMYEIINYRYMGNLPLVISTEKSLEGLLEFDEATGSRIIEMCMGNIVWIEGRELNYRMYSISGAQRKGGGC